MPDFSTVGQITLQPGDSMGYAFKITVASSSTANDGFIPHGTSVSDVDVVIYDSDGTAVTTAILVGSPSIADNVISLKLKHPGYNGRFKITFNMTLSNGDKKEADFGRLICEDH